jgi:DNA-binding SARP family transcriptional activator
MAHLTLGLLGPFEARLASGEVLAIRTRKAQALTAFLSLPLGQRHSRGALATLLWGEMLETQARGNLRQTLFNLRKNLGPAAPALCATSETVSLDPATVDVDVAAFAKLVDDGTPDSLGRAAALYRGELLAGVTFEEEAFEQWLTGARERLRELAIEGFTKLVRYRRETGSLEGAIRIGRQLVALDPVEESGHRMLMRLYAEAGRRSAALRQYQDCVTQLQRDLGVEPEAATRELYQQILTQKILARPALAPSGHFIVSGPTSPQSLDSAADRRHAETTIVGREAELAKLREALARAAIGEGGLVALVGEGGVGKSRVIEELIARAAHPGLRVLLGHAHQTEQILPFGPWVDALRTGRLEERLHIAEEIGLAWRAELTRLLPELAPPDAKGQTGMPDYLRLFESVLRFLVASTRDRTLLLILEDLHWADEMSQRLLAFLGRRVQSERVLVIVTVRDEELDDAPILRHALEDLSRARHLTSLELPRLSQPETIALVRVLAPTSNVATALDRLAEQVWLASEGNPLMAVETMRAVHERVTSGGSPVPDRIREILSRRFEKLGETSHALLATAAVVGRRSDFELLRKASGLDEDSAASGGEELVRRRILTAVGENLDFTHDRIREVVYAELPAWRRKQLHRRVAEAIEESHGGRQDECAEALAIHYREAEAWQRAALYLHRAGNRAVARSAYRAAVRYFDDAIAALGRLPDCTETRELAVVVRLDLRNALVPLGETERIAERLREAETIALVDRDRRRLGWISAYMAAVLWRRGDYEQAGSSGRRALELARACGDAALDAEASFYLGMVHFSLAEYGRSLELLRKNLRFAPADAQGHAGFVLHSATARLFSVLCHAEQGRFAEGQELGEEAVRIAEAANQPFFIVVSLMAIGELHLAKGEFPESIAALERAHRLCETSDVPFGLPWVSGALGYVYALSDRRNAGIAMLEQALAHAAAAGLAVRDALYLARWSDACLASGRLDEALALFERALALARERGEHGVEAFALRVRGDIAAHEEALDLGEAEHRYRQSLELAESLGMRPLVARCRFGLGTVYLRKSDRRGARQQFAASADLFRELGMMFWWRAAQTGFAKR